MAQPTAYRRAKDFTAEAGNATAHASINAELDAIATTLADLRTNLAILQRDDTLLKNASVHINALSSAVLSLMAGGGFTVRGAWLTATAYVVGDVVEQAGASYVCAVAHTSGTFATDYGAGNWVILWAAGSSAPAWLGTVVVRTAVQSIANSTPAKVTWQATLADTSGAGVWQASAPTRLTVPIGVSRVRFHGQAGWDTNATGGRMAELLKNGGGFTGGAARSTVPGVFSDTQTAHGFTTPPLAVSPGDYFELQVRQTSGSALDLHWGPSQTYGTWLEMEILG